MNNTSPTPLDAVMKPLYQAVYKAYRLRDENDEPVLDAVHQAQREFCALIDGFPVGSEFHCRSSAAYSVASGHPWEFWEKYGNEITAARRQGIGWELPEERRERYARYSFPLRIRFYFDEWSILKLKLLANRIKSYGSGTKAVRHWFVRDLLGFKPKSSKEPHGHNCRCERCYGPEGLCRPWGLCMRCGADFFCEPESVGGDMIDGSHCLHNCPENRKREAERLSNAEPRN